MTCERELLILHWICLLFLIAEGVLSLLVSHVVICISYAHTRRLSGLSKLKELKLYDNRVASVAGLQGLSALHTLDISSNRLTTLEVRACFNVWLILLISVLCVS